MGLADRDYMTPPGSGDEDVAEAITLGGLYGTEHFGEQDR